MRTRTYLCTYDRPNDDVVIIDPERDYAAVVGALGGEVIDVHTGSRQHLNPLDIVLDNTCICTYDRPVSEDTHPAGMHRCGRPEGHDGGHVCADCGQQWQPGPWDED